MKDLTSIIFTLVQQQKNITGESFFSGQTVTLNVLQRGLTNLEREGILLRR